MQHRRGMNNGLTPTTGRLPTRRDGQGRQGRRGTTVGIQSIIQGHCPNTKNLQTFGASVPLLRFVRICPSVVICWDLFGFGVCCWRGLPNAQGQRPTLQPGAGERPMIEFRRERGEAVPFFSEAPLLYNQSVSDANPALIKLSGPLLGNQQTRVLFCLLT